MRGELPCRPTSRRGPESIALLLIKSVAVTLVTVGLFFAGQPIALVALVAAGVLLLGRVRPEKVYGSVDWPLLVMFAGLFVVVHAFEVNVVQTWGLERWHALLESPVVLVSGLSVLLSNLVSNVPAVLLFKPLMEVMPQKELAWLALAMSSTLAGNLTVLGSVANLIVVENARRAGTELSFLEYLKVGVPLTMLTTLVGVAWLCAGPILTRRGPWPKPMDEDETRSRPVDDGACRPRRPQRLPGGRAGRDGAVPGHLPRATHHWDAGPDRDRAGGDGDRDRAGADAGRGADRPDPVQAAGDRGGGAGGRRGLGRDGICGRRFRWSSRRKRLIGASRRPIFPPAIAALTLGLVGHAAMPAARAGTRRSTTRATSSRRSSRG